MFHSNACTFKRWCLVLRAPVLTSFLAILKAWVTNRSVTRLQASAIIYRKTRVYGNYQWVIVINASIRSLTLQPNATPSDQSAVHFKNPHYNFRRLTRGWIIATSNKAKPTPHLPSEVLADRWTAVPQTLLLSFLSPPPIPLPQSGLPPSSPFPHPSFSFPAPPCSHQPTSVVIVT